MSVDTYLYLLSVQFYTRTQKTHQHIKTLQIHTARNPLISNAARRCAEVQAGVQELPLSPRGTILVKWLLFMLYFKDTDFLLMNVILQTMWELGMETWGYTP